MSGPYYESRQPARALHHEPPGAAQFLYHGLPENVRRVFDQRSIPTDWTKDGKHSKTKRHCLRELWPFGRPSRTKIGLILLWMLVLWWGERSIFLKRVRSCQWENWESWPSNANPHHVVLLADPQLVDPHTYPGRPWPLSTLTIRHTDLYLRRSFASLQRVLQPDTAFFLGDLFDGGREWATGKSKSPDKNLKKYDSKFWLKEYGRFGRIFFENWSTKPALASQIARDRKIVASLPGNHDLGLGSGIRLSVRDRFSTYFGYGNRIDVVGNHTVVSVDTVSLSAKGQSELDLKELEKGQKSNKQIWETAEVFLSQVEDNKARAVAHELRARAGRPIYPQYDHVVSDLNTSALKEGIPKAFPNLPGDLPTILLTHVPLYRAPGTPCGPQRERWPPSRTSDNPDAPVESDDRNAISVSAGYQYQNVLHPDVSKELIEKVGNVQHVFSGDDHDYCEVVHRGYTSQGRGIREITVKSMSWAMGIRRPGFLMLSLWNPIDNEGNPLKQTKDLSEGLETNTIKSHLCLLPDQLSIFIHYLQLLGFTLLALAVRAVVIGLGLRPGQGKIVDQILPLTRSHLNYSEVQKRDRADSKSGSSSSNSSDSAYTNGLAARPAANRTRSVSPAISYGIPIETTTISPYPNGSYTPEGNGKSFNAPGKGGWNDDEKTARKTRRGWRFVWTEMKQATLPVASIALIWFLWLAYIS